jgi:hypothetical protein
MKCRFNDGIEAAALVCERAGRQESAWYARLVRGLKIRTESAPELRA